MRRDPRPTYDPCPQCGATHPGDCPCWDYETPELGPQLRRPKPRRKPAR
jgi:hypothetical protein